MKVSPDIRLAALDGATTRLKNARVPEDELQRWYANAARRVKDWRMAHDRNGGPLPPGRDDYMSQIDFAERAKVSVGCVQGLETGAHRTRDPQLLNIARAIGLTSIKDLIAPIDPVVPPTLPPSHPLVDKLFPDDLEVALMYQTASGPVKSSVRRMLEEYYQRATALLRSKEALRLPSEATFPERRGGVDRRSGEERRRADRDAAADRRSVEKA